MIRPNYLGIGAIKAGTTWAAENLAAHPSIFMAHGKELHYFSQNYTRGNDWYLKNFPTTSIHQAVGEFSVTYMDRSEETAKRIYEFNADFRLIVSIRDPVERAFSQYRWEKQMGTELPSFIKSLELRPDLITNSCYAANLAPYWNQFPDDQFFYIRQADIRECPSEIRSDLYRFLDVDPTYDPNPKEHIIGDTIQPRSRLLENMRIQMHSAAMRYQAGILITIYKRLGLSQIYRRLNNDHNKAEVLSDTDRKLLAPLFAEDLEIFRKRTGISVTDIK
ncbi:MAG: hypothetical protein DRR42_17740 [Gammaproteobacteria bacterium]|nr:MAG: hypothetical protein DRR42_17740 [Gammaproteobacteria bacterium]